MGMCANHPNIQATGRCAGCAEEFCNNCLVDIQGQKFCGACKASALGGKLPTAAAAVQEAGSVPSPLAKEALTYAIVGIFCFGFILGPIAIVKGLKAKRQIAADPQFTGDGKATAAIIIGIIATILNVLGIIARVATLNH